MKEGLPVNTGAGRIEYKMNESNNFDGVDVQVRDNNGNDKRNRLIAGALTVAIGLTTPAVAAFADGPSSTGESQIKVTDTLKSQEVKSVSSSPALVFQLNNPYYATFDKTGNYQIQKSLISPKLINGEVFGLTTKIAENLSYKTTQNEAKKTTTYKNNEKQITFKNGSRIINILDLKTKRLTNITAKNAYQYNKDGYLCKGSESLFLTSVGKNSLYGSTNISKDFKEFLQKVPEGGGFQIKDMSVVLNCLEPGVDYGTNRDKMTTALEKYKVFPVALNNTKTACVSESLYNKTWGELKKDNSRFKLIGALDLLDEEVAKKLGIEEKYKADKNLVMLYKDENQTVSFRKDIKTGLTEGWKLINGKEVKVAMNKETRKFEEVVAKQLVPEQMTVAEKEVAVKEVLKYSADIYVTPNEFTAPMEKMGVGITLCYSSTENQSAERALAKKISSYLKAGDVVNFYGKDNGLCAYVFNKDSRKVWNERSIVQRFDINGNRKEIYDPHDQLSEEKRTRYCPLICFDRDLGPVLSDFAKATWKFDGKTFVEMGEYKMYGTERERNVESMRIVKSAFEAITIGPDSAYKYRNTIDSKEIDLYERTGSTDGCKTIEVLDVGETSPWILKTNFTAGNLESIKIGMKWLHTNDPGKLEKMVNRSGCYCIDAATNDYFDAIFGKYENGVGHVSIQVGDQVPRGTVQEFGEYLPIIYMKEGYFGMFYFDHEYLKGDKRLLDDSVRRDLVVPTNSAGIAKEAGGFRWAEEMNGNTTFYQFDQDEDVPFEYIRENKHNRLTFAQYARWLGTSGAGYKIYRTTLNKFWPVD